MSSDGSNLSINTNNPLPIQPDDRQVNSTRGEDRDRGKFQKLLARSKDAKVDGEQEADEEIVAEKGSSFLAALGKKKSSNDSGGLSFGESDKDELLALISGVEEKEKGKQGIGTKLEMGKSNLGKEDDKQGLASADASLLNAPVQQAPPLVSGVTALSDTKTTEAPPSTVNRAEMWSVVEKLVDTITAMKGNGTTETTLSLKGPPVFQGAQVKIVESDTAHGQFNIAFENLSPQAKALVDLESNRQNLRYALEQKGYMLHIVTSNLEIEKLPPAEQAQNWTQQDRGGGQQGQGQQQQNEEEEA